jgi:hypothetical protein
MDVGGSSEHRRVQRKVAREYRKLGFKVLEAPTGDDLPPFLAGFSPDLIATNDDDHVVVEIKRADKLKGSNELTELAAKVAEHPNWRFELFALEAPGDPGPSVADLDLLFRTGLEGFTEVNKALHGFFCIGLASILEALINRVALERGIDTNDRRVKSIIGELSFQGVIGESTTAALESALAWRDAAWHGGIEEYLPGTEEIMNLARCYPELRSALVEYSSKNAVQRKQINYTSAEVSRLADTRPAVYAIQTTKGRVNYVGFAESGRLRELISRHLNDKPKRIRGDRITILEFSSEDEARRAAKLAIEEYSPAYNEAPARSRSA